MRTLCVLEKALAVACLALTSCTTEGPQPPKPGTPNSFWLAAHANFGEADFTAAHRNLDQVELSENPYKRQAAIWMMVLSAGMARGAMEWSEILDAGGKAPTNEAKELQCQATAARKAADRHAMHLAELVKAYQEGQREMEAPLPFAFPDVSVELPAGVDLVKQGILQDPSEAEKLRAAVEQRNVALTLCRLMGTGSDTAKAKTLLNGHAKLPAEDFELYLAQELMAISELYGPKRLGGRARAELLLGEAGAALQSAGDTPKVRALAGRMGEKLAATPE